MKSLLAASLVLFCSISAFAQKAKLESFTPTGNVSTTPQVHAKFSAPLSALGASAQAVNPFVNSCESFGTGRWLNPQEWVFDFTQPLAPKTQCNFQLRPNLKSEKGIAIADLTNYSFTLAAAALQTTIPNFTKETKELAQQPGEVDPDQAFVIHYNAKLSNEEIAKRLYFTTENKKEEIPVKIESAKILKSLIKDGQVWIDQTNKTETWTVISPQLEFPNQENLLITLHDRETHERFFYKSRPFFRAEFNCNRDTVKAPCSPIQAIDLNFNSPIAREDLKKIKITGPTTATPDAPKNEESISSHEDRAHFKGPFKAGALYKIELPRGLKDIRGRILQNASQFPLSFKTDSLPSVAKFPGSFGVLETSSPLLPLSVRNIEKSLEIKTSEVAQFSTPENARDILKWLARVDLQGSRTYDDEKITDPNGKAMNFQSVFAHYPKDLKNQIIRSTLPAVSEFNQAEVLGIPITKKGLQIVEVQSKGLGKRILNRDTPLFTSTAVLLTNLGVHFKWGQHGPSLVWVTQLSDAKPVSGAEIKIQACNGKLLASGVTQADGTLTLQNLPNESALASKAYGCDYKIYHSTKLVVLAKKDDDFSFALDTWNQGIEPWRFHLPRAEDDDTGFANISTHTVLARDLLKPGQKLNMKHYFREFHWQGFSVPKKLPHFVIIKHLGSGQSWNVPVKFDAQGIALSNWLVPESANLGEYTIALAYELPKKKSNFAPALKQTANFNVQEFRLPTLNVSLKVPDPITSDSTENKIALQGKYLSGGPSSGLPVELRFQRKPAEKHSRKLGDYIVAQDEPIKTGIRDQSQNADDSETEDGTTTPSDDQNALLTSKLSQKLNLDAGGSAYADFPKEVLNTDQDAEVRVALTYTDPNGEIQTSIRPTSIFSRDRYLSIHQDTQSYQESFKDIPLNIKLNTVRGEPVAGEPVQVEIFQDIAYVHRARLVGGFYGYHTTVETKKIGEFCSGKTGNEGKFSCQGNLPASGSYQLQITSRDSKKRALYLVQGMSVYGGDENSDHSNSDRLTLVPDHESYGSEGNANLTVQSPFKNFTALVTLERGGVMDHFINELSGDKPVVSIPLKAEFSPNVVVSVLAVRGRIADPAPTGLLDLAKPAFRLGMTMLKTGQSAHLLPIKVTTDKPTYQVRDTMKVTIDTKPNAEIALAVIDQALLKLHPNATWNLLDQMITLQNHDVQTSTLQMNLIGKRHFGKKATPFGGGGGNLITRELLDSLVTWMPNLKADANGKISTQVKLNDSISSFTVVAIGTQGMNLYGTGKTEIASTQDLQIISSVPPTLRETDHLPLQFILRNTTQKPLHINATLKAGDQTLSIQSKEIPARTSTEMKWDFSVPKNQTALPILLTAIAQEGPKDALKTSSKIVEVTPVRTVDGILTQLSAESSSVPVKFPEGALLDKGGYRIALQARLSDVPSTLLEYLRQYSFNCFEQQTSKAIGLNDLAAWKKLLSSSKNYLDTNHLIKFFPEMRYGSIDLTAYVLLLSSEASKTNPGFSLATQGIHASLLNQWLDALKKAMRGQIHVSETWWPNTVVVNDRIAAAEALSEYQPIPVADYESLKSVYDHQSVNHLLSLLHILKRSSTSLKNSLPDADRYTQELNAQLQIENTHVQIKGAKFRFFGALNESPDALQARLLLYYVEQNDEANATRALRTLLEAMKHGALDTTPADAWSVIALARFRKAYEKKSVSGVVTVTLDSLVQKKTISEKAPSTEIYLPIVSLKNKETSRSLKQSFSGNGNPWSFTFVEAAVATKTQIDHGFLIQKTIEAVQVAEKGKFHTGDLYKVHLKIEGRSPQAWLALSDPIPTGASILQTESAQNWIAFQERRMDRMQVFFEYLGQGSSEFTYTVRLNQAGEFDFPATRLEAMYDPTQYGEAPNAKMVVTP